MDTINTTNWRVRCYNKRDKIIKTWVIKDRTELEAQNEAEADVAREGSKVADWSMTEITK